MGQVNAPILNSLLNTELEKIDPREELPGKCPAAMGF
jgi:hypothetical protein